VPSSIVDVLLASDEPSVRWKVRVHALGEDPDSRAIRRLQGQVRRAPRTRALIDGRAANPCGSYTKWQGGHWVLAALADLGYPAGDPDLLPLSDQLLRTWLAPRYLRDVVPNRTAKVTTSSAVPVVADRHRRCASQQGNALLSTVALGLDDGRAAQLVERLLHWQWPDGGWNCDKSTDATFSSVYETLLPMRGLTAYAREHQDPTAQAGARRAAEVLLDRRLLFRRSTGRLIRPDWSRLHFPVYWHYDVLAGLKGLAEAGLIGDPRCDDALDLLESKRLPDGGWPAEARYYKGSGPEPRQSFDHVDWGGVDKHRTNEWVTADALAVLAAAGRLH
jgi:hypothetical protein